MCSFLMRHLEFSVQTGFGDGKHCSRSQRLIWRWSDGCLVWMRLLVFYPDTYFLRITNLIYLYFYFLLGLWLPHKKIQSKPKNYIFSLFFKQVKPSGWILINGTLAKTWCSSFHELPSKTEDSCFLFLLPSSSVLFLGMYMW